MPPQPISRNNRAASQLSQSIAELNAKLLALERLRTKGYLAADIYHTQTREIRQQLDKLKTERYSSFESKILTMLEDVRKLKSLIDELDSRWKCSTRSCSMRSLPTFASITMTK